MGGSAMLLLLESQEPFMCRITFVLLLALGCTPALSQDEDPPPIARLGRFHIEERNMFRRLIDKDVMIGVQIHEKYLVRADSANVFGVWSPFEVLLQEGSLAAWNPRLEPLSYYHRTGPIGAIFHELRTRNRGRDAAGSVGIIGLECGTPAAYAIRDQSMVFYEPDPDVKALSFDTDRYFTYIRDARLRKARVDVRIGNVRKNLETETERFAVLLVELYNGGFDPGERLTLEAVKLYMDRVRDDGLVALHISNKYFRLEPVIAAIARELKLAGRVWNDDSDTRPGKTASSWVVLARNENALGVLGQSVHEQAKAFGTKNHLLIRLLREHSPDTSVRQVLKGWARDRELTIEDFGAKFGSDAQVIEDAIRRLERLDENVTFADLTLFILGAMFHELTPHPKVGVRKDGDGAWPRAALIAPDWWERLFGTE
jgi:hypothetical protein